ncbi:Hddc2 [Columba guinea]|nr:Hddc2 [Columba guinea]
MAAGPSGGGLLPFLRLLGQLKRVPRTGWVYRNVAKPESVSDHMYRMAMMALVSEDKSLNKDRCIRLALVHDMAECIVGDIAPADNISKEEKHRREESAMQQLTQLLSEDLGKEIYGLWEKKGKKNTTSITGRLNILSDIFVLMLELRKFVHPEIVQLVSQIKTERNKKIAATSHPHS